MNSGWQYREAGAGDGVSTPGQSKVFVQLLYCVLSKGQTAGLQSSAETQVSALQIALKVAVTVLSLSIVKLQVPVSLQAPDQPVNVEPAFGVADRASFFTGAEV